MLLCYIHLFPHHYTAVIFCLASVPERYDAAFFRVKRMVFADRDIAAREKDRAALAHEDISRFCFLTRVQLNPQEFRV